MAAALLLLVLVAGPAYAALPGYDAIDPAAYLSFNEGSGTTAYDLSAHGNAGMLHNVTRAESGGCGNALVFAGVDNYVSIPWRTSNHPEKEIAVTAWFYTDAYGPQQIVSTCYRNGGYCLGFDDGRDLWWTVNLKGEGPVSVNVRHEGISMGRWHHVAGIYDGKTTRIYFDGVLYNQQNATGPIAYEFPNYLILGAGAGAFDTPDPASPRYFHGGLDEVRIYDRAIPYAQIMDDRFHCTAERIVSEESVTGLPVLDPPENAVSGSLNLKPGVVAEQVLVFPGKDINGTWKISMEPGSKLTVMAHDLYPATSPDSWYLEIADEYGRIDRTIIFPGTRNAPVEGVIKNGNAIVTVRYFDGRERFPNTIAVLFSTTPPAPVVVEPAPIVINPIIVIYSASWATLIALVVVFLWLRKRHREKKRNGGTAATGSDEPPKTE